MAEILIAEDEKNIREAIADLFAGSGYRVRQAANGVTALSEYNRKRPDVVLLDVMMPKKDGFATLVELRRRDPLLPVILLTALGDSVDKVKGLGLGADDYVTKPFELDVLLARVARALQRVESIRNQAGAASTGKAAGGSAAEDDAFLFAGAKVEPTRMCISGRGIGQVELSSREIGILRLFVRHPGEVLGREHLLGTLWGVGYLTCTRTLDQHITALRRKLGDLASTIETVYGTGYRYVERKVEASAGE